MILLYWLFILSVASDFILIVRCSTKKTVSVVKRFRYLIN